MVEYALCAQGTGNNGVAELGTRLIDAEELEFLRSAGCGSGGGGSRGRSRSAGRLGGGSGGSSRPTILQFSISI